MIIYHNDSFIITNSEHYYESYSYGNVTNIYFQNINNNSDLFSYDCTSTIEVVHLRVISDDLESLPYEIKYYPYIKGDITNDDIVNVVDIISSVDLIMTNSYHTVVDLNFDNILNVSDIILLIDIVLNGASTYGCTSNSACNYNEEANFNDKTCVSPDLYGFCNPSDMNEGIFYMNENGELWYNVDDSNSSIYGLQLDIHTQHGISEDDIEGLFLFESNNVSLYSKVKEPGFVRVIIFDLGGNTIHNQSDCGILFKIQPFNAFDMNNISYNLSNVVVAGTNGSQLNYQILSSNNNNSYIEGNYPNPFNPTTTIEINLAQSTNLIVTVHKPSGQVIELLYNDYASSGSYSFLFDASASNIGSGTYIVSLHLPDFNYFDYHYMTYISK